MPKIFIFAKALLSKWDEHGAADRTQPVHYHDWLAIDNMMMTVHDKLHNDTKLQIEFLFKLALKNRRQDGKKHIFITESELVEYSSLELGMFAFNHVLDVHYQVLNKIGRIHDARRHYGRMLKIIRASCQQPSASLIQESSNEKTRH